MVVAVVDCSTTTLEKAFRLAASTEHPTPKVRFPPVQPAVSSLMIGWREVLRLRPLALLLSLLACSSPTEPPAPETFVPGLIGPDTQPLADGNLPGPVRGQWVPVRFDQPREIASIGFRTGTFVGAPSVPEAQIVIATMSPDHVVPARIVYASRVFNIWENTAYAEQPRFTPAPGVSYLIGVIVYAFDADDENYVTLRIWDDPATTEKPLPIHSSGGDAPSSAGFSTADYQNWGYAVDDPWSGEVMSYVVRHLALWLELL